MRQLQRWARSARKKPSFKEKHTLEQRRALSQKILQTYPDRLPVIAAPAQYGAPGTPQMAKEKFLVPVDFSAQMFMRELRRLMGSDLSATEALYMFVGKSVIVPTSLLMSQVYEKFKDEDGFLYIHYSLENTFG